MPMKKHRRKAGRIRLSVAGGTLIEVVGRVDCVAPQCGQFTAESCISLPHPLQKTITIARSLVRGLDGPACVLRSRTKPAENLRRTEFEIKYLANQDCCAFSSPTGSQSGC